jgi:hypothetical protein
VNLQHGDRPGRTARRQAPEAARDDDDAGYALGELAADAGGEPAAVGDAHREDPLGVDAGHRRHPFDEVLDEADVVRGRSGVEVPEPVLARRVREDHGEPRPVADAREPRVALHEPPGRAPAVQCHDERRPRDRRAGGHAHERRPLALRTREAQRELARLALLAAGRAAGIRERRGHVALRGHGWRCGAATTADACQSHREGWREQDRSRPETTPRGDRKPRHEPTN